MPNKYVLIIENHLIYAGTLFDCVTLGENIQKIGKCELTILSVEMLNDIKSEIVDFSIEEIDLNNLAVHHNG